MDKIVQRKISLSIFRDMWRNSVRIGKIGWKEHRRPLAWFGLVGILVSVMPFVIAGSRGFLINELIGAAQLRVLTEPALVGLILFLLAGAAHPILLSLQFFFEKELWFRLEEKFEMFLMRSKATLDIAAHETPKYNDLLVRVRENGVWRINNFTSRQFYIFQNLFEASIAGIILAFANVWIFFIVVLCVIPALFVEFKYGEYAWGIWTGSAEDRRKFFTLRGYFDWLPSLIEMKIFSTAEHFVGRIIELFRRWQSAHRAAERIRLRNQLFSVVTAQAAIIFAGVWFVYEVVRGEMQVGTLTFFLAAIGDFRQALSSLFMNLGRQYSDSLFVTDAFKAIDIPALVAKPSKGLIVATNSTPTIEFKNVSFRYPGTEKDVLKDFSIFIQPGDKLAIVGANGAGKTTFVKLLCRFYDPTEGTILVNGKDLREIDLESYYKTIGALFQDYMSYRLLVKEAIAASVPGNNPPLEKIKESAKAAEADVFIQKFEKKYEQQLSRGFTDGVEPSVGQWQKLALARAFYRDPRILILDEPTSSIDAEAEAKIFEKLEKLPSDRTVILISHRFSTVRQANQICVIEDGTMTELGTHEELLKNDKSYARLFKLQAKGYR